VRATAEEGDLLDEGRDAGSVCPPRYMCSKQIINQGLEIPRLKIRLRRGDDACSLVWPVLQS